VIPVFYIEVFSILINYILHCCKVGLYCPEIGFVDQVHILQSEGPRVEGGVYPRAVIIALVLLSKLRAIRRFTNAVCSLTSYLCLLRPVPVPATLYLHT
jgi:hypothetical protein